jgi:hypothetical protein
MTDNNRNYWTIGETSHSEHSVALDSVLMCTVCLRARLRDLGWCDNIVAWLLPSCIGHCFNPNLDDQEFCDAKTIHRDRYARHLLHGSGSGSDPRIQDASYYRG